ncbi:hypothetical protein EDD17DRAFT_1648116 [Pisolithus thermaeus]|nr:hypothetical protein EDD17DRAFT_1648116 [Pisolithus thermaeus]
MSQKLILTTNSLLNTTISNAADTIYYGIQTPEYEPQLTIIRRAGTRMNRYNPTGRSKTRQMILSRLTFSGAQQNKRANG